jgi:integrase
MDPANVAKVFRASLKRAKLPNFRLYDLRHTAASLLLNRCAPITFVAAMLGHSKPTTTLAFYAHQIPSTGRSFADLLDTVSEKWNQTWNQKPIWKS